MDVLPVLPVLSQVDFTSPIWGEHKITSQQASKVHTPFAHSLSIPQRSVTLSYKSTKVQFVFLKSDLSHFVYVWLHLVPTQGMQERRTGQAHSISQVYTYSILVGRYARKKHFDFLYFTLPKDRPSWPTVSQSVSQSRSMNKSRPNDYDVCNRELWRRERERERGARACQT